MPVTNDIKGGHMIRLATLSDMDGHDLTVIAQKQQEEAGSTISTATASTGHRPCGAMSEPQYHHRWPCPGRGSPSAACPS